MDLLDRLIGHDRWTTERLLGYCRVMSPEEWGRNFRIGNGSLRATFEHVLLARKVLDPVVQRIRDELPIEVERALRRALERT